MYFRRIDYWMFFLFVIIFLQSCFPEDTSAIPARIGISTTMLAAAVHEWASTNGDVETITLIPAGSCPGYFDMNAGDLDRLRGIGLFIRHDYQSFLDERLNSLSKGKIKIFAATSPESYLIPGQFAALVKETAFLAAEVYPANKEKWMGNVVRSQEKLWKLQQTILKRVSRMKGTPVVASETQADFCNYLGLAVVGTLARPEDVTPQEYRKLLGLKAKIVIGNLQEGEQAAQSLAEKMGIPAVILSNFPGADGYGTSYEQLLENNLRKLEKVCPPR